MFSTELFKTAISAFLADEINMDKYGIDAVILSSQKALSLAPGLSVVALSEKILNTTDVSRNLLYTTDMGKVKKIDMVTSLKGNE